MIIKEANYVETFTLNDAWRDAMWLCVMNGWDFVVKEGSYKGQIRKQLPYVTIKVKGPGTRPLAPMLSPPNEPPTTEEKIKEYFHNYLMSDVIHGNEQYTYGSFIKPQLMKVIELLVEAKGNTNQARIAIGDRDSVFLTDPPCLNTINFKVVEKKLVMSVVFRSWDLFSGLPQNLGGLQMLKEFVLEFIQTEFEVQDGPLVAFSDGLHLYEYAFELADMLNVEKVEVSKEAMEDKNEFAKTLG